jgi:hypothetical protein
MSALRVLFIGNSQMQCGDLPAMIKAMSESAPADAPRIEPGYALTGGKSLKGQWDLGEGPDSPRGKIAAGTWDQVVIQEIFCAAASEFEEYAAKFDEAVRRAGARPVLFATANVTQHYNPAFRYPDGFRTLNDMQIEFGRKRGIVVAAAGYAWMRYLGPNPTEEEVLALYHRDKGHPGMKGSVIYANLLYAVITGRDPRLLPAPEGDADCGDGRTLTRAEVVRMRAAAWEQSLADGPV